MKLLLAMLCGLPLFAQPIITAWTDPVIRYNDQYGPPKVSPGPGGCVSSTWNGAPCTGRWTYGDTFARTYNGTTGYITGNDTAGAQTGQNFDNTFRSIMLGSMSANNLTLTNVNLMDQFGNNSMGFTGIGACSTNGVTSIPDGTWKSSGLLAYHANLYWWLKCQNYPSFWSYNATLLKSSNTFSTYTYKNHSSPVSTVPATADLMFAGDATINVVQWLQYANCPDNYNCPYTRPHGGETYAYGYGTLGGANSFDNPIPLRVTWANLESDSFNVATYSYLTFTGTRATCADGDVGGNWSTNFAAIATASCYVPGGYSQYDAFYSFDLNAYTVLHWRDATGVNLAVSSTPWGPSNNYVVTDAPVYGTKFVAADLRTYQAVTAGGVTTVTVDVTSSGNNLGTDFTASSNYSMAIRTLHMSTPTPGGGTSAPSGGKMKVSGAGRFSGSRGNSTGGGSSLSVQVIGNSNTQAVLGYTAPDSSACTVQVSESNTLTPLVHDVDSALFAGSNMDNRASGLSNGTARIFVVGKRAAEQGTGGSFYSRALQTLTTHYYAVTCGSSVALGNFTTLNIPIGNTFNEVPAVDPATGLAIIPTFPNNNTTTVIDHHSGALAKRATLPGDNTHGSSVPSATQLYSGGRKPMCGSQTVGPDNGHLCKFPTVGGYPSSFYYYVPATGAMRFLGKLTIYNGVIDPSTGISVIDGLSASDAGASFAQMRQYTYTGNFLAQAPDHALDVSTVNLTPGDSWQTMVTSYDATLNACSNIEVNGPYALQECHSAGGQDSYGYMGILDLGDKLPLGSCTTCMHMIAAVKVYQHPETRWCAVHSAFIVPNTPLVLMEPHSMDLGHDPAPGSAVGLGQYRVSLTTGVSSSATAFVVSGEPQSRWDIVEPFLQNAAVNDVFLIRSSGERIQITAKADSTHWTVTRGFGGTPTASYSSGEFFEASCASDINAQWYDRWWSFLSDPTASTAIGYLAEKISWGGHEDVMPNGRVQERDVSFGPIMSQLAIGGIPLTSKLTTDPTFAGIKGWADGNSMSDYPNYHQVNASAPDLLWFLDEPTYFGATQQGPGATLIGGSLYKYNVGTDWITTLHRKQLTTITSVGRYAAVDISSPATGDTVIGTTSADNYKYCVANAINECRQGSAKDDVYINMPGVTNLSCLGAEGPENYNLCLTDLPQGQGAYQFGVTANTVARPSGFTGVGAGFTRKISYGFEGVKLLDKLFKSTPDGKWAFLDVKDRVTGEEASTYMVKLPPMPTTLDPLARETFVRVPVPITAPGGLGIARAAVEFGYAEYGTAAQHYCTSRQEACLATAATVTDATPFWFATTESSATASALSCSTSCTVMLPLLPLHVAYWQVRFYDAGGAFVALGPKGIAMEGGATILP